MAKRIDETWQRQLASLGGFIRDQRTRAKLSLRELADRTKVSNAYLSQIERGLHEPSVHVLKALATALDVSAETLLQKVGVLDRPAGDDAPDTEAAIAADPALSAEQKRALLAVYRSYRDQND